MGGIVRLNQLPEGSGNLTSDDIFVFMDSPSSGGVTKKVSLDNIKSIVTANIDGGEATERTLYFYSPLPTNFNNLDAWYTDETHKIPASSLPNANDLVVILTGNSQSNPGTLTAKFVYISDNSVDGSMKVYGTIYAQKCYFYSAANTSNFPFGLVIANVHADCEFAGYATLGDTVINGTNYGTIYGNCVFNDNARTLLDYNGTMVVGDCVFNDYAINEGYAAGNCTFNDSARNGGSCGSDPTHIVTFNDDSANMGYNGGIIGGGNGNGNCVFNDNSFCNGHMRANAVTFNDMSFVGTPVWGVLVANSVTFNDNATFNGGTIDSDTVTFNDSSSVLSVAGTPPSPSYSYTGDAIVYGNCVFNDASTSAVGYLTLYGSLTFNSTGVFAGNNYGDVTVNSGEFNGYITTYDNPSPAVFNGSSRCSYGALTFGAIFNDSSIFGAPDADTGGATAGGSLVFNDNSSMVSGQANNCTFNDASNYYGGEIAGTKTCNTTGFCASLFFYADPVTSFDNPSAWFLAYPSFSTPVPATALPTSTDDVVIMTTNLTGGGAGSVTANRVFVKGSLVVHGPTRAMNVYGTITGNCVFNGAAQNSATITGNCTFNDTSNNNNYGTITGDCTFNDISYNGGTINGNCTFNDYSYEYFANIDGENHVFNDNSYHGGILVGDATFNDNSHNRYFMTFIVGDVIFNDATYNDGQIDGNATFNDNSSMFRGPVSLNATFNDNSNYYNGVINGTKTCNTTGVCTSRWFYADPATSFDTLASWYTDSAHTIPATSLPTSNDDVAILTSNDGGTLTAKSVFVFNSTVNGTITANCIFHTSEYANSSQSTGTINGNCTFNQSSVINSGTIIGNCIFNNTSEMQLGSTITGKVTFNDTSEMINGTINGRAIFNDSSTRTGGTVTGAVICNTTSTCSST